MPRRLRVVVQSIAGDPAIVIESSAIVLVGIASVLALCSPSVITFRRHSFINRVPTGSRWRTFSGASIPPEPHLPEPLIDSV
jgi:hypothetical protein